MGDLFQPLHLIVLCPLLFSVAVLLLPAIFYCLTLQKALSRCAPASRTMEPMMVWLYLVPVVNLVFHFFIVSAMTRSLGREFQVRRIPYPDSDLSRGVGLTMCITACCSIIPLLGFLAAIAYLVPWVVYWVKIAGYSAQLELYPAPPTQVFQA